MSQARRKCLICEQRPVSSGKSYCKVCCSQIQAENRRRETAKPSKFLTYRGNVVGLFPTGRGTLTPRLVMRNPEKLPKCRTIDLNIYQQGFTREQIKEFKKTVISLTAV